MLQILFAPAVVDQLIASAIIYHMRSKVGLFTLTTTVCRLAITVYTNLELLVLY